MGGIVRKICVIVGWIAGLWLFFLLLGWAGEQDRKDCEERIATELKTTAVFINNNCMVKGYGRFDGR
ncbi:hypothetical protein DMS41_19795 [Salmonella enterica]|nr:hypothetical protein [Salmonella enterica subsp. enterica serovar Amager]EAA9984269.1 hypothetical protein [Salmonella enterica subsp. enterica serovar Adelaide]EAB1828624.1 hypothetical protein [Salmonella enterica]EAB7819910.1 hypothetical protein [Salmonella enterica subsp. enterica]EBC8648045.1 hypothetical protein [Salmonella enterica subsp. enterica serovar Infantis]EBH8624946.1 hypothetical protein [Salmonella enterica subsp. enterica serovar Tees]EBV2221734.1 hypothetical protein [